MSGIIYIYIPCVGVGDGAKKPSSSEDGGALLLTMLGGTLVTPVTPVPVRSVSPVRPVTLVTPLPLVGVRSSPLSRSRISCKYYYEL